MRVGGREPTRSDARIISATNRDLAEQVRKSKFREDLFFRLNVVPIVVPPLRARKSDIPELLRYFVQKINREMKVQISGLAPDAEAMLVEHSWPGNVRELENVLRRLIALRLRVVEERDLPRDLLDAASVKRDRGTRQAAEAEAVERALAASGGNKAAAARILGVDRKTLYAMLRRMGKS